jgi:hypothetical protein
MKLKTLFIASTILGVVLGLGFFFAPAAVMSSFGVTAGETHQHTARNFGSAVIGLAVISWWARNAGDSNARRAIVIGLFTYFVFSSISIISFQLEGKVNHSGWLFAGLNVLFLLGFGFHLIAKKSSNHW